MDVVWFGLALAATSRFLQFCRAKPAGHDIPFVFADEVSRFFNTFSYDADEDSWRWLLNSERDGELVLFADVALVRK